MSPSFQAQNNHTKKAVPNEYECGAPAGFDGIRSELRVGLTQLEMEQNPTTCLVTGGSSFVGSAIVKRLLACGHIVHATSREFSRLEELSKLEGAKDRLKIFACDLTKPGSYISALQGCTHVFHVASPVDISTKTRDVDDKLLKPAVEGVDNVLSSCCAEPSVVRVVLTSSLSAMAGDFWEHGKHHEISENDWNNCSSKTFMPYRFSKVCAERRAWEIGNKADTRWSLCVINPGFPIGPPVIARDSSQSIRFCRDMMRGKYRLGFPPIGMPICDIDQVAQAHVVAAFNPRAEGRYVCASEGISLQCLMKQTESMFEPRRKFVGPEIPDILTFILCKVFKMAPWEFIKVQLHRVPRINNSKASRDLFIDFIDAKQSLADMVRAIETSTS